MRILVPTFYHVNLADGTVGIVFAVQEDGNTIATGRHIVPLSDELRALLSDQIDPVLRNDDAALDHPAPSALTTRLHQWRVAHQEWTAMSAQARALDAQIAAKQDEARRLDERANALHADIATKQEKIEQLNVQTDGKS